MLVTLGEGDSEGFSGCRKNGSFAHEGSADGCGAGGLGGVD